MDNATIANVTLIVRENVDRETRLMTDESGIDMKMGREFLDHETMNHGAGKYVSGDTHTNTVEGFFSIFKRGFKGIYPHCGEPHLHRYLAEYDFRYNNRVRLCVGDGERASRWCGGQTADV